MSTDGIQHIGDDQTIFGLPKHMEAVAGDGENTYWEIVPGKDACFACRMMSGRRFDEKPSPVHPNCTCEIRRVVTKIVKIDQILQGFEDRRTERFGAGQIIILRITNLGPFIAGVRILLDQMEWHTTPHLHPGGSHVFHFSKFGEPPVTWEISLIKLGGDNSSFLYSIRG